ATQGNGTTTNVRGDVFWCASSVAGGSPLTVQMPSGEPQRSSYVIYHLRAADTPYVAMDDGGNDTVADFTALPVPQGNYLHIVAVAVDYKTTPTLALVDPDTSDGDDYLDGYYIGSDNTAIPSTDEHAALLCADVYRRGASNVAPPSLQYSSDLSEQWVSFNIMVPRGEYNPPDGDPPTVSAGSDAQVVSGAVFERTGTYDANDATNITTTWEIVDGPADVGSSANG